MGVAEIRLLRAAFAGEHEDIMMAMLMQNTSEEEGHGLGWVFPLFHHLPSIESVRTDVLEEDENRLPGVEADSSNVSRIAIHHSSLDIFYLVSVLSWCKVLPQFEYSIGRRSSLIGGNPFLNPKTFILNLLRHTQILGVLDIDVEAHISEFTREDNEYPDFERHGGQADLLELAEFNSSIMVPPESFWKQNASLQNFESLKRLSIGVNFLIYCTWTVNAARNNSPSFCLIDSLPPNLEYICIRVYEKGKK
ncbi:hypothetical protein ASPWEDRAFT_176420 [Aspergillus wentii DTO 134E9]|uniref:Uncharacterized protein n=1 Tax=Aspergillus wentii DTO 134E9 TaxID=1073089 RepID=A0A1L9R8U2_ASPWE|nr:uncharacterized protein ASPWEDRAFT_176420 [Aspergillus wentii DTO 134E9]OJJ31340.1 hypothetical protein ASPWEDRAFT_176420 [Aspergillus wentii DTO 134E9]